MNLQVLQERVTDAVSEVAKGSPVIIGGVSQGVFDATLPRVLNVLLVIYAGLQIGFLLWKWRKAKQDAKDESKGGDNEATHKCS